MDEFDASTAPTEGRQATSGHSAAHGPPRTAADQGGSAPEAAASSQRCSDTGALLSVSISRPVDLLSPTLATPPAAATRPPEPDPRTQRTIAVVTDAERLHQPQRLDGSTPASSASRTWRSRQMLSRIGPLARRIAVYGTLAFGVWFAAVLASIAVFRYIDPPFSNLMLLQRMSGEVVVQRWLPIDRMPAQVIRAIVVSEDGRFCQHGGIDLKAIEVAIETARDGTPRGASTITMQVAKNLYLWPSKSYVRKALEVPITLAIETMWSKRRIFEVYANIAEWGPGVFGVEAAAGYHFGKSAGRVSEREAALLAVALPNPVTRDAGDPGPGTERLANTIQSRMRAQSSAAACIERPRRA